MVTALLAVILAAAPAPAVSNDAPSRPPVQGCAWEKIHDGRTGIEVWVSRCDFGSRQVDFLFQQGSLAIRYSDGGDPDPVVDVLDLSPGETPEAGIRRIFSARTPAGLARRCVLAPYRGPEGSKTPAGAKRFTFVPDPAFAKELAAKVDPNEVGDPPCGEWGESPDGIQYFEAWPASRARKVLFVRVGQDEPLFDEQSIRLIEPPRKRRAPAPAAAAAGR